MSKIPFPSEHRDQVVLFAWARIKSTQHPELDLMFAIPNGGLRNARVGKAMKAEGVKRGVPDIMLPVARAGYHGLWIEMKSEKVRPKAIGKGGVSEMQAAWHRNLRFQGYFVHVCYGFTEASKVLESYLES